MDSLPIYIYTIMIEAYIWKLPHLFYCFIAVFTT